jgi:IMP and pyridine-specific 5'-nucleotidase
MFTKLDELALSAQSKLNHYQANKLKEYQNAPKKVKISESDLSIPFCAFNGGSDVWVDIGNKLIGVQILCNWLGTFAHETLHVGDQFLSTGNDIATRSACCTLWITNPEETHDVLLQLNEFLRIK